LSRAICEMVNISRRDFVAIVLSLNLWSSWENTLEVYYDTII